MKKIAILVEYQQIKINLQLHAKRCYNINWDFNSKGTCIYIFISKFKFKFSSDLCVRVANYVLLSK